jgi:hypothetical protein
VFARSGIHPSIRKLLLIGPVGKIGKTGVIRPPKPAVGRRRAPKTGRGAPPGAKFGMHPPGACLLTELY